MQNTIAAPNGKPETPAMLASAQACAMNPPVSHASGHFPHEPAHAGHVHRSRFCAGSSPQGWVQFIIATAPGKLTLCKICGHMTGMAVHLVAISV
jgi:hypothetical protein